MRNGAKNCQNKVKPKGMVKNLLKFSKRSSSVQSYCIWSGQRMSFNICERETSYCLIRSPYRPLNFLNDDFKCSMMYPCSVIWFEVATYQNKTSIRWASPSISYKLRNKDVIGGWGWNIATQERKICDVEIEIVTFVIDGSVKLTVPPDRQK